MVTEHGTEVIPFIRKLWDAIEHPSTNDVVYWRSDTQFVVKKTKRLAKMFSTTYVKLKERLLLYNFRCESVKSEQRFSAPIGFARGNSAALQEISLPLIELRASYRQAAEDVDGLHKNRTSLKKDLADIQDRMALCEARNVLLESDMKLLTPSK